MNRKAQTSAIYMLAIYMFSTGGLWYMNALPDMMINTAEQHIEEIQTATPAKTLKTHLEDHIVRDAVNWSFYHTSATFAADTNTDSKQWSHDDIPDDAALQQELQQLAQQQFRRNYLDDAQIKDDCSLTAPSFIFTIDRRKMERNGVLGANFTAKADTPAEISCVSPAGKTLLYTAPVVNDFSAGNRFFYLAENARQVVQWDEFRATIADTLSRSSNRVEAVSGEEYAGNCNSQAEDGQPCPYNDNPSSLSHPSFGSVSENVENEQEAVVAPKLENALNNLVAGYDPGLPPAYDGVSFAVEVVEVEYTIEDYHQVSVDDAERDGWRVSSCQRSCFQKEVCDEDSCSNSYPSCGCSATCTQPDAPECPPTICSTSSFSNTGASGRSNLWTHDPWKLNPREAHSEQIADTATGLYTPFIATYPEQQPFQLQQAPAPITQYRQIQETGPGTGGGETEEPQVCSSPGDSCKLCDPASSASNRVFQQPRRIWQIDTLSSTVTVKVTVTDDRYTVPMRHGDNPLTFNIHYTQKQTWDFNGPVTYPVG